MKIGANFGDNFVDWQKALAQFGALAIQKANMEKSHFWPYHFVENEFTFWEQDAVAIAHIHLASPKFVAYSVPGNE